MAAYMEKSTHEAKVHTSWISPDPDYDAAVREFVAATLENRPRNRFVAEFQRFHDQVVNWGLYGALSQTLLSWSRPACPTLTRVKSYGISVSSTRTIAGRSVLRFARNDAGGASPGHRPR